MTMKESTLHALSQRSQVAWMQYTANDSRGGQQGAPMHAPTRNHNGQITAAPNLA